jgi:hypothetical protein
MSERTRSRPQGKDIPSRLVRRHVIAAGRDMIASFLQVPEAT